MDDDTMDITGQQSDRHTLRHGILAHRVPERVRLEVSVNRPSCLKVLISCSLKGQMIVAKDRLDSLRSNVPEDSLKVVVPSIKGADLLEGGEYINVLSGEQCKLIHADFVTSTSGTGLVHLAPGHGMDDYNVLMKLGIGPAFAPVDDDGKFTAEALPADPAYLSGLYVESKGAKAVIDLLRNPASRLSASSVTPDSSLILATHEYTHKNPIDWRTKQPVITRATEQWFADVGSIKDSAMEAIDVVDFIPQSGKSRLQSFLQGRSQWCISRQRSWGVPIPALFDKRTGEAIMTAQSIKHIISVIEQRGTDAWWSDAADDPIWISPELQPGSYVRGKDTMDVWFDSGTSWTSLEPRSGEPVADIYVEGTDQHRGWFQSSLLTHIAQQVEGAPAMAPYKTLITHGFTLDHEGRKMSKSLGNVITPEEILSGSLIPAAKAGRSAAKSKTPAVRPYKENRDVLGPDVLRLWVAGSDYTKDVVIGQPIVRSVHQSFQKLRVTFKWLLGVISDYPSPPTTQSLGPLYFADQVVLHQLSKTSAIVHAAQSAYEFHRSVTAINRFVNVDLSAFYFEVIKDRIYAEDDTIRQHTQTVLYIVFEELLRMLTPITPHLVAEIWAHVPEQQKEGDIAHPLIRVWDEPFEASFDTYDSAQMETAIAALQTVTTAVKAAQEEARQQGKLGSSLACAVELQIPEEIKDETMLLLSDLEEQDELSELFVVSDVQLVPRDEQAREHQMEQMKEEMGEEIVEARRDWRDNVAWEYSAEFECGTEERPVKGKVVVLPPNGEKCMRCWQYTAGEADGLCGRCVGVVGEENIEEANRSEDDEREEEVEDDDFDDGDAGKTDEKVRNDLKKYL